ncbi:hypothetical protein K490DRAFT_52582 [Saccharata proteae CBS 121410]|uniref:Uncharacterized protein n=1 Tax=Saccharata proteae CBS 121410 TaxID=1314787 RepID=A0A9P4HY35_9PEZI|nr:hypothetical protein K490DRAFT_52582 [Saccharata proteae CBS 121410]
MDAPKKHAALPIRSRPVETMTAVAPDHNLRQRRHDAPKDAEETSPEYHDAFHSQNVQDLVASIKDLNLSESTQYIGKEIAALCGTFAELNILVAPAGRGLCQEDLRQKLEDLREPSCGCEHQPELHQIIPCRVAMTSDPNIRDRFFVDITSRLGKAEKVAERLFGQYVKESAMFWTPESEDLVLEAESEAADDALNRLRQQAHAMCVYFGYTC